MATVPQDLRIARRLRHFRECGKHTQEDLSSAMGFKDRQTLAAVEAGTRKLKPVELVAAASFLGLDLDAFLDPFRLVGEGRFSFRVEPEVTEEAVESFAERAGRWIATYRELGAQEGIESKTLVPRLDLRRESTFEEAQAAGESLWRQWNLGDVPADRLEDAITKFLDVLVLYVDAPVGVSGAASTLPGLQTILVNRRESRGRRNFDLAHELFHVLTWDAMPPEWIELRDVPATKGNRVEQLANNFAAALLMPEQIVRAWWEKRLDNAFAEWVLHTANELRVSADALQWRLVALKMITKSAMLRLMSKAVHADTLPLLFSRVFISRVHQAVEAGRLSLRRAATLLDLSLEAFGELCRQYGLPLSYDVAPVTA